MVWYLTDGGAVLGEYAPGGAPAGAVEATTWIDAQANARIVAVASPHVGIMAIYIRQLVDVIRLSLPGPSPTPEAYPALGSLINGTTIPDVNTAAARVLADDAAWAAYGGAVNKVRRDANEAIAACTTSEELAAVLAGIVWIE